MAYTKQKSLLEQTFKKDENGKFTNELLDGGFIENTKGSLFKQNFIQDENGKFSKDSQGNFISKPFEVIDGLPEKGMSSNIIDKYIYENKKQVETKPETKPQEEQKSIRQSLEEVIDKAEKSNEYLNASFSDNFEAGKQEKNEIVSKAINNYLEENLIKTINEAKYSNGYDYVGSEEAELSFKEITKERNEIIQSYIDQYTEKLTNEFGNNSYKNEGQLTEQVKSYVDYVDHQMLYVVDNNGINLPVNYLTAPENKHLLEEFQKDDKAVLGALKNDINLMSDEMKQKVGNQDPVKYLEAKLHKEQLDKELAPKAEEKQAQRMKI